MSDISVFEVSKFYGDTQVLREVSFELHPKERAGLIGVNGAGKTTLFNIIAGKLYYDGGRVAIADGRRVGLLDQLPDYPEGTTVRQVLLMAFDHFSKMRSEMEDLESKMAAGSAQKSELSRYAYLQSHYESAGGYNTDVLYNKVANGLSIGREMQDRHFASLSGGEKTRVCLARMLMEDVDILLLDEPTNHLDMQSVAWLEGYLRDFRGSALIISHDRYFLDNAVTKILELEDCKLTEYSGNYTFFVEQKEISLLNQQKMYEQQQRKLEALEFTLRRMKGWGLGNSKVMRRAFSLEKRLDRMERIEKVRTIRKLKAGGFVDNARSGDEVLSLISVSKGFGERTLFSNLSLDVERGERVAIIGENGSGKTTLLKLILGLELPDDGRIKFGSNIKMAYLPQVLEFDFPERTVLDTVLYTLNISTAAARNRLGSYLFEGEDVFKRVCDLSGGEKSRLMLCVLMFKEVNFLVLDEPTNHLDIASREWMESTLSEFAGTMLFVSHDRYFLDRFTTRIINIAPGNVEDFLGTFEIYAARPVAPSQNTQVTQAPKMEKKEERKPANSKKLEKRLRELEREIEKYEKSLEDLELEMDSAASDHEKLLELISRREETEEALNLLYKEWESLA